MEKPIWYPSEYSFELLENVAIFRLKPILCMIWITCYFLKKMTALSSLHQRATALSS